MKYLITITLLIVLSSCDRSSPKSPDSVIATSALESVAVGKTPDILDKPLKGHVGRAGLYRLVRSGGVINDPSTSTGKSVLKPVVELVTETDRIPLIKGVQMYLQYRIWPLPALPAHADLRRVLKHPEMTLPDGKVSTGSDYVIKVKVSSNQAIGYTGYGLDEDYELVEGDWVFEVWYQGKKMIDQTFITYWPNEAEIARLEPLLALGNRAVGMKEPTTGEPFSRFNWSKVVIGGKGTDEPAGVTETKQSLDDPLNQP